MEEEKIKKTKKYVMYNVHKINRDKLCKLYKETKINERYVDVIVQK